MGETVSKMFANLREYFSKMPRRTRVRLVMLTLFVIVLSIVAVAMLTRTKWVVLPGTSDSVNPGAIPSTLAEIGISTRPSGFGFEVPEDRLEEAVSYLRERGLMGTSAFDDYYLSQAANFGVSTEHAKQLYDMQTAEHIKTMILQNRRVQNALVIINSGESSPFRIQTNTRKATASVAVTIVNGGSLTQAEAQTIGDIVKGAVPGIAYEDITIADQHFNSFKVGDGTQSMEMEYDQRIELQNRLTDRAKAQTEQLLYPIYGMANLRVQPSVTLNFDKVTIAMVEYDPPIPGSEEGVIRSSERIAERSRAWANAEGIPGTDSNNMGTVEYPFGEFGENDYYSRDVISVNNELNETRTAIEKASGTIEEFSITVLVNSEYLGEGVTPPDYSDEVRDLVSKGIGVSENNISVQYIPFSHIDTSMAEMLEAAEEREAQARRERLIDMILQYGTILILAIMVIVLVRSIVKALVPREPELVLAAEGAPGGLDIIVGDSHAEREYEDVDLNQKSAGLEQIERFIDKDPASVTQLLRNWLSDE